MQTDSPTVAQDVGWPDGWDNDENLTPARIAMLDFLRKRKFPQDVAEGIVASAIEPLRAQVLAEITADMPDEERDQVIQNALDRAKESVAMAQSDLDSGPRLQTAIAEAEAGLPYHLMRSEAAQVARLLAMRIKPKINLGEKSPKISAEIQGEIKLLASLVAAIR